MAADNLSETMRVTIDEAFERLADANTAIGLDAYFAPRQLGATALLSGDRLTVLDYRENMPGQKAAGDDSPLRTLASPNLLEQIERILNAGLRVEVR